MQICFHLTCMCTDGSCGLTAWRSPYTHHKRLHHNVCQLHGHHIWHTAGWWCLSLPVDWHGGLNSLPSAALYLLKISHNTVYACLLLLLLLLFVIVAAASVVIFIRVCLCHQSKHTIFRMNLHCLLTDHIDIMDEYLSAQLSNANYNLHCCR